MSGSIVLLGAKRYLSASHEPIVGQTEQQKDPYPAKFLILFCYDKEPDGIVTNLMQIH